MNLNEITDGGGVYLLIRRSRVVYVGQSGNVRRRIKNHHLMPEFDSVSVIAQGNKRLRLKLERQKINDMSPKFNGEGIPGLKSIRVSENILWMIKERAMTRRASVEEMTEMLLAFALREAK